LTFRTSSFGREPCPEAIVAVSQLRHDALGRGAAPAAMAPSIQAPPRPSMSLWVTGRS